MTLRSGVETNSGLVSLEKLEPRAQQQACTMLDLKNPLKSPRLRKLVLLAIVVLSVFAIMTIRVGEPSIPRRTREQVLKTDLQIMRDAIDDYTLDKRKPPTSLQDLVNANYLRAMPVDPITNERDWTVDFDDVLLLGDSGAKGIVDVHSSSAKISLEGTRYNAW